MSDLHVLALDSSSHQSHGAEKRFMQTSKNTAASKGSLTFRTTWLGQSPSRQSHPGKHLNQTTENDTFEECIGKWLSDSGCTGTKGKPSEPTAVVLVSLHACGSLTPTILRYGLAHGRTHNPNNSWFTAAVVVVGCCYNLLEIDGKETEHKHHKARLIFLLEDFPLSKNVQEHLKAHSGVQLTSAHYQAAAQIPSAWLHSDEEKAVSNLAMKKVLFRSLISPAIQNNDMIGPQRLGRLKNSVYENFETFLSYSAQKLAFDEQQFRHDYGIDGISLEKSRIARRIEVLHAARCLLGPAIESLLILDRVIWLKEQLGLNGAAAQRVHMINLFDQNTGSGRNIAIVLRPM